MKDQRLLTTLASMFYLIGFIGLATGTNQLVPLWAILIVAGSGFSLSLAMMFFSLRTRSSHEAAEMSRMVQSIGYLTASVGPFLFDLFHDLTQGWTTPLLLLIVTSILMFGLGLGAARTRFV